MSDFNQLLKVLRREIPDRPVLFEFFLNERLYKKACGAAYNTSTPYNIMKNMVKAFHHYGYDHATVRGSEYWFHSNNEQFHNAAKTVSLNESSDIFDKDSFDRYKWMDASKCDYSNLEKIKADFIGNQKVVVMGPGGVLENAIALMGFDNLCMTIYDDPQLVFDVFEKIGTGLVEYYNQAAPYDSVGALISNDDWGFNTQTMLSPSDMRRFVFPWHKKIVDTIHKYDKPAILHSCGNYCMVFDDLIGLGYDARHSYEDNIIPVEEAYKQLKGKIAVLGGIDVNFLIKASSADIRKRATAMLTAGMKGGGYALGSGNSIPDYVPDENFFEMIKVVSKV